MTFSLIFSRLPNTVIGGGYLLNHSLKSKDYNFENIDYKNIKTRYRVSVFLAERNINDNN